MPVKQQISRYGSEHKIEGGVVDELPGSYENARLAGRFFLRGAECQIKRLR